MCSNCNQTTNYSCNGCGGYRPSNLSSCLPCGPLQLETSCGSFKLLEGASIKATVDYCNHSLTLSVALQMVAVAPTTTEGVVGEMRVDNVANRLYIKTGDTTWKYVALT